MTKAVKLFGLLVFTFVLFVVVGSLAFYQLIRSGEFRRFLVSEIEAKTELKVQLGEADLEIGRILGIAFLDVALSEPDGVRPAMTAQRISARIALLPLFERKVVLYGLRLHHPTARLVRDKEGRIALLDKLLNLPFLKEKATQFDVDFHAIRIEGGEVDFDDQQAEQSPTTTYFRDVDLRLERIRGGELRDLIKQVVRSKQPEPHGAALDFELKSAVGTESRKTTLRAKGKMIFPEQALEFRKAWWNVQVQLSELPAELVQHYVGSGVAGEINERRLDAAVPRRRQPCHSVPTQGRFIVQPARDRRARDFCRPLAAGRWSGRVQPRLETTAPRHSSF